MFWYYINLTTYTEEQFIFTKHYRSAVNLLQINNKLTVK